jgi:UTP--glucose-1-phosphate uridylyltransferase
VTQQLIDAAHENDGSVLAVMEVEPEHTDRYGIVEVNKLGENCSRVTSIVEKPDPAHAPSTLAVVGRYVLEPAIFSHLQKLQAGVGGEIQLTDGIASLIKEKPVFGHLYDGIRYDCGSKEGFYKATIEIGRKHHGLS